MANIFIGADSFKSLDNVLSTFEKKRISQYKDRTGYSLYRYHPFINHSDIYSQFSNSDLEFKTENFLPDKDILMKIKLVFKQQNFLTGFSGANPHFEVFSNISEADLSGINEIQAALNIIESCAPWIWKNFRRVIQFIVPVTVGGSNRGTGGSSDYYLLGMFFVGLLEKPWSIEKLAISFAHELGHNCLMVYQSGQIPVLESELGKFVYSGVRKTDRPVLGAFHAAAALGYMVSLCDSCRGNKSLTAVQQNYFSEQYQRLREDLHTGLSSLEAIKLSDLGNVIYDELKSICYE